MYDGYYDVKLEVRLSGARARSRDRHGGFSAQTLGW